MRAQSSTQSLPAAQGLGGRAALAVRALRKTASGDMPAVPVQPAWEQSFDCSASSEGTSTHQLPPLPAQSAFPARQPVKARAGPAQLPQKVREKRDSSGASTASVKIDVESLSRKTRQNLDRLLSSAGKAGF